MSGFGEGPPLTELVGMLEKNGCAVTSRFGELSTRHLRARVVKEAAFILRRAHGTMHHSTARMLALALEREGLLGGH